MRSSRSKSSTTAPSGASSCAALASAVLYDSRLRLPESARMRTSGLPDGREVRPQHDVVREEEASAGERRVPLEAPVGAVDRSGKLEADALVAPRIVRRPAEHAAKLDRLRDALDRELALDDDLA